MQKRFLGIGMILMVVLLAAIACRTPAGRGPGQVAKDAEITSEVKTKLLADNFLRGLAISVDTFEGQTTLTGAVNSPAQKEKAAEIARSVSGVKKVNNLINVKAISAAPSQQTYPTSPQAGTGTSPSTSSGAYPGTSSGTMGR